MTEMDEQRTLNDRKLLKNPPLPHPSVLTWNKLEVGGDRQRIMNLDSGQSLRVHKSMLT